LYLCTQKNKEKAMFKRIYTLFIIIMGALGCMAQMSDPVKFSVSKKINANGQLEVSFQGTIESGWHVYGSNFKDGGPQRAIVTLEKGDGVKQTGSLKTIGDVHRGQDPMFMMEVETIEDKVTFVQTYELTGSEYDIAGYLTYGACNDQNCLPPTSVDFSFKGKNTEGASVSEETDNLTTAESLPAEEAKEAEVAMVSNDVTPVNANDLWAPVTDQLQSDDNVAAQTDTSLIWIFFMGIVGGMLALLTPCV
jgi:thiol:disulfide interchange protein DsbD